MWRRGGEREWMDEKWGICEVRDELSNAPRTPGRCRRQQEYNVCVCVCALSRLYLSRRERGTHLKCQVSSASRSEQGQRDRSHLFFHLLRH